VPALAATRKVIDLTGVVGGKTKSFNHCLPTSQSASQLVELPRFRRQFDASGRKPDKGWFWCSAAVRSAYGTGLYCFTVSTLLGEVEGLKFVSPA
jgi:hypothetical protein